MHTNTRFHYNLFKSQYKLISPDILILGYFIDDASIFATYLHGECAHQYKKLVSIDGLTAADLPTMIPFALESIQDVL